MFYCVEKTQKIRLLQPAGNQRLRDTPSYSPLTLLLLSPYSSLTIVGEDKGEVGRG